MKLMIYSKQTLAGKVYTMYSCLKENGKVLWEGETITEYSILKEKLSNAISKRVSFKIRNHKFAIVIMPRTTIDEINNMIYEARSLVYIPLFLYNDIKNR